MIGVFFFSIFTYVVIPQLYGQSNTKHHSSCGRVLHGLVSHVTKNVLSTQTTSSSASHDSDIVTTSSDKDPTNIPGHDGIIATTKTKISSSDFPNTLPGATAPNSCTQSSPCSGDITTYDPSVGSGACGGLVYQPTDNVIAIAYGMMGTLSSGTEKIPLCGRYIKIENPAMVVDKCMGCVSG